VWTLTTFSPRMILLIFLFDSGSRMYLEIIALICVHFLAALKLQATNPVTSRFSLTIDARPNDPL
jgi:hypothetical protein